MRFGVRANRRETAGGSFLPSQLGSSLVLWLRADMGVTIATGVSSWADQSGAGNNATQATGSKQPALSSAGGPNNTACITGDGVSKFLATGNFTLNQPWELFVVAKWVSGTAGTLVDANSAINHARIWQSSANVIFASSDGGVNYLQKTALTLTNWAQVNVQWNGASAAGSWGTQALVQGGGTGIGTNNAGGLHLFIGGDGVTDPSNASVAEVIAVNAILSATARAQVKAYLLARYGV